MLIVNTYVDESPIHGLGIFAVDSIPKNKVVWIEGLQCVYTQDQFDQLSPKLQSVIRRRGWKDKHDGLYRLSLDNDQFTNHSSHPNTAVDPETGVVRAVRDIAAGEEITCDYYTFDLTVEHKLFPPVV